MHDLVDIYFPVAEKIALIMDNLNMHKLASLYEAFQSREVRHIIEKLEIRYTTLPSRQSTGSLPLTMHGSNCPSIDAC